MHATADRLEVTPTWRRRLGSRLALSALLVGTAVGLVACGSDGSDEAAPAVPAGTSAAAFPVTITHKLGTARITTAPKRVVALGIPEAEIALSLGVTPVGIPKSPFNADGLYPWLAGKVDPKTTTLLTQGADASFNTEQIAALRPDLILAATDFSIDKAYANLSKLAPTVAYDKGLLQDSWDDVTRTVGKALGRPTEADALVTKTDNAIAKAKTDNPGAQGKTYAFALGSTAPGLVVTVSPQDFSDKLFTQVGLTMSPTVRALPPAAGTGGALLSFEQLDKLSDADLLLVTYLVPTAQATVEGLAGYKALPAVAGKHVQVLPPATATALRNPGPLSIEWALEQITPALASFTR
ncbi:ABC transporter substrate-binding protein [Candidatus Frankia nodulisporulans]|uniref:ABC transporter substrate-binding protein n=1 Tax=Candidatus Frankia nodulisporulans TaxID=2060052 RepID=UPI0013D78B3D|nr:ABC transporter substrate-binding protein [Candidatus Frankia nodulisporulans]